MYSIDELMASFVVWHGEVPLEAVPRIAADILKGQVRGRVIVNVQQ